MPPHVAPFRPMASGIVAYLYFLFTRHAFDLKPFQARGVMGVEGWGLRVVCGVP